MNEPQHRPRPAIAAIALACALVCACREPPPADDASPRGSHKAADQRTLASQTVLSDEVLWELGPDVRRRVVAVSAMADDPRYSGVVDVWDPALPRLRGTSESLLSLQPDYVIIASFTAAETIALLGAHGVPTLTLDRFSGFDDYTRHVRDIAAVAGAAPAGAALAQQFTRELEALSASAPSPRVDAISFNEGTVAGAATTFDDVAQAAGLRNVASEFKGHRTLPLERVIAWDPAVIVIACAPPSCAATEAAFAQRPGFAATRAARTGGVIALDPPVLYSVGHGMLDAVRSLQARHPNAPRASSGG